jgi:PhnB protein
MKNVNIYLNFDGNCRQAMTFYHQCLGTEIQISPFPDAQGQPSSDPHARVMHARLTKGNQVILMASDTPPGGKLERGNNFSVSVDCDSVGDVDRLFAAMSLNGQVTMPLAEMFWGARFGMLRDQFGIQWMFNCELPKKGN